MVINGKEQPGRQHQGASRLYAMEIFFFGGESPFQIAAESLLQKSLLYLHLSFSCSLPKLQPFPSPPVAPMERSCASPPLLLVQPHLLSSASGLPVDLSMLLEDRTALYTAKKKEVKMN